MAATTTTMATPVAAGKLPRLQPPRAAMLEIAVESVPGRVTTMADEAATGGALAADALGRLETTTTAPGRTPPRVTRAATRESTARDLEMTAAAG
jgi:hypothetical protein